ncbi:hypothetical protein [Streptomyces ossamyceticus]|uniref:hypothetical protein n=1 Tax=Streptomyces ossamyceticus TaxID=249581 RepID=UPI0006E3B3A5|nr:hypothetical protein [Streptomyces ossamyceticus]
MPSRVPNRPVCRSCDGFPVVSITTGDRHRDGSRATLTVACPACKGTGHTLPASAFAKTGR